MKTAILVVVILVLFSASGLAKMAANGTEHEQDLDDREQIEYIDAWKKCRRNNGIRLLPGSFGHNAEHANNPGKPCK